MSRTTLSLACTAILLAMSACKPVAEEPATPASESPVAGEPTINEPAAVTPQDIQGAPLELAIITQNGTPQLLTKNDSLSGQFNAPQAGNIRAVHVQIGNFGGSSDGTAKLKACQAEVCQEGTANLVGSMDNNYLRFTFAVPLTVIAGRPVAYTFTRIDGSKPFAVWSYPVQGGELTLADGSKAPLDVKIALSY